MAPLKNTAALLGFAACNVVFAQAEPPVLADTMRHDTSVVDNMTVLEVMPVFKGGEQALHQHIADNTKYPRRAVREGLEGRVWINFVVEKDGSVSGIEVAKGVHPLLDAEALRVVGTLPVFEEPGHQLGKPVRVRYRLPIHFKLK
jgi:periplasmic protein TonB